MEKVLENPFKTKWKTNEVQYGVWLDIPSAYTAEIAAACGYDWLVLDGEHCPNTITDLLSQLRAIAPYPTHPIVRVLEGDDARIKQILDIGAKSIVVPMVDTAEQARAMVRAMRYPPEGVRGTAAVVARATRWNRVPNYMDRVDESLCLILQAESVTGMANLEEVCSIDGVDGIFIGPVDLATSMGFKGDVSRPEVQSEVERGIKLARAKGKGVGVFALNPEFADKCAAWGANMIAIACDALALSSALEEKLDRFRPGRKKLLY
ncbi:MAG: 2-keto-3-deoxy-L-rhamnonate aldolase [Deltaproteobacteria bacterium]|nr:2-keto-3-deoxy-L-rhamnonate aldolase [Deltaproteobacteria bacterium]